MTKTTSRAPRERSYPQPIRATRFMDHLSTNALCWREYLALEPFIRHLVTPSRVLDIGPGLGRSAIFFKKIMGWQEVPRGRWSRIAVLAKTEGALGS